MRPATARPEEHVIVMMHVTLCLPLSGFNRILSTLNRGRGRVACGGFPRVWNLQLPPEFRQGEREPDRFDGAADQWAVEERVRVREERGGRPTAGSPAPDSSAREAERTASPKHSDPEGGAPEMRPRSHSNTTEIPQLGQWPRPLG